MYVPDHNELATYVAAVMLHHMKHMNGCYIHVMPHFSGRAGKRVNAKGDQHVGRPWGPGHWRCRAVQAVRDSVSIYHSYLLSTVHNSASPFPFHGWQGQTT